MKEEEVSGLIGIDNSGKTVVKEIPTYLETVEETVRVLWEYLYYNDMNQSYGYNPDDDVNLELRVRSIEEEEIKDYLEWRKSTRFFKGV